jgi:thiamine biosynthesis lipoprotein
LPLNGCKLNSIKKVEETRNYMGTFVNIIVYSDEETANNAINSAFDRIEEIEKIASIYDENSEATSLNRNGYLDNPSQELTELINASLYYYEITGGSFDITVQPVLELWSEGLWKESEEVQAEKIKEVLLSVGSDKIKVGEGRIEFEADDMSITLGGIAKGYAVDEALKVIGDMGIKNALVNAGGDMGMLGSKPDGEMWNVELKNPDEDSDEKLPSFILSGKAIATSGNYERYFDPDKKVHHITNPKTGYSADGCISATIIADSCMEADALATSIFVMGPEDGLKLVESLDGVEALIIDPERNLYKSSGLADFLK